MERGGLCGGVLASRAHRLVHIISEDGYEAEDLQHYSLRCCCAAVGFASMRFIRRPREEYHWVLARDGTTSRLRALEDTSQNVWSRT